MVEDIEKLCMCCMREEVEDGYCQACGHAVLTGQKQQDALPLRTILNGQFMVGKMLGAGGFGITYVGVDLVSGRKVAIKEFMPSGMVSRKGGTTSMIITSDKQVFKDIEKRFLEEAQIIYKYQRNPHILQVYSLFEENNTAYYVMEYLDGTDLKSYVKDKGGVVTWDELLPFVLQVIDALAVLHKDNVIHRDISPDNILISPNGKAKLIDFGSARQFMTQKELTVILKRRYAPIEQYQSKGNQGPWTDIYALSASLYYCLTAQLPPEATARAYQDDLKSFAELGVTLNPNVEAAIYKGLSIRTTDRFQDVISFRNALLGRPETPVNQMDRMNCMPNTNIIQNNRMGVGGQVQQIGYNGMQQIGYNGMQQMGYNGMQQIGYNGMQQISYNGMQPLQYRSENNLTKLVCISGIYVGREFMLQGNIMIGRNPAKCQIIYPNGTAGVSGLQCVVCKGVNSNDNVTLCDMGSSYGTWLNGNRIQNNKHYKLSKGDKISFGENHVWQIE